MNGIETTAIKIDIDVHRAIEARRKTFSQSHNAILREIFSLPEATDRAPDPPKRRTGTYSFILIGERVEEGSLKAAYLACLLKMAELDSQFLESLSKKTTKARRIVSRDPRELYLRKPELSEKYASRLTDIWWVDTNLSQQQCEQRLKLACEVAGLQFGNDLELIFPS